MADETYVQVAVDGAGKKIRNLSQYTPLVDGSVALTYDQVLALVNARGQLLDLSPQIFNDILEAQCRTNELLEQLANEEEKDASSVERGPVTTLWGRQGLPVTVPTPNSPVRAMSDIFGRTVVLQGGTREQSGTQATTISASTSETAIVTATPGLYNDLVMLLVSNTSAATSTRIDFRDTTGGTVLFSLQSIGGGTPVGFALPVPIPQTKQGTNWTAQCATSTTDIRIYAVVVKNR